MGRRPHDRLTRINRVPLAPNADLIEYIEITPDMVVSLTNGQKFVVLESADINDAARRNLRGAPEYA